jgi:diguanylate cyclase (GGDEF)-like protein/PAS domain S-box-containing protein
MKDEDKTKEQLINELAEMRRQVADLEAVNTERQRAEEALRESEGRFRELIENANDVIYTHDLEGNFTSANRAATRVYGYTIEEILRLNITQIVDPEYLPLAQQKIREKLKGVPWTEPYELLTYSKEGEPIWVEVSTRLLKRAGQPVEVQGIARDITERKRAEEALRESESRLSGMLSSMVDLVFAFDSEGRFNFYHSPHAGDRYFSPDEFIGRKHSEVMPPHLNEPFAEAFEKTRKGEVAEFECWLEIGGRVRWFSAKLSPVFLEGEFTGSAAVVREITENKWAEEELTRHNQELAALNAIATAMMQSALDLNEVLQLTADGIVMRLGCNTGFILLLDEEKGVLSGAAISTQAGLLEKLNAIAGYPLVQSEIPARMDYNETMSNLLTGRITIKHEFHELIKPFWSKQVCSDMQKLLDSKTFFAMPLLARGKTVGGLIASAPKELDEGDTERLMAFANQAAIAIENARLYEAERRRSAELEALRQASLHLISSLELQPILEAILDHAFKLVSAYDVHIFLYDGEQLAFGAALWGDGRQRQPYAEPRPHGLTYAVARGGEPIVVPDVNSHPLFRDYQWGGSIVSLPLRISQRVVGVMTIAFEKPRAFDEGELRVLGLLADQAAIAIENARLYEETRQRALEQETLREAALALTTALDRNKVIDRILAQLQQVVPYDSASIQLLRGDMLVLIAGRGFPNLEELLDTSFPVNGDNPNREVMRTLAPSILQDAPVLYEAFTQEPFAAMGIRSWLGVPMLIGDRPVGMITLDKREAGFYTQEHARLAEAFAAQAAVAIENAGLFEETEHLKRFNENVVQGVAEAILIEDAQGILTFANPAAEELLGYTCEELIGRHWTTIVPEDEIEKVRQELAKRRRGTLSHYETALLNKEGQVIPVIVSARPLFEEGEFTGVLSAFTDIRKRVRAEREIEERRMYLEGVLRAAPDAIVTLDAHHRIVEWNSGAERLFGYSREEAIGKDIDHLVTSPDVFEEAAEFTQVVMGGMEVPPTETIRYRKDGSPVDVILAGSPILVGDKLIGLVGVYTDITARKQMEEALRAMALVDDLTGLYNRRGFFTMSKQQLKMADRTKIRMILLFADFDNLKHINDTLGHPEGDRALMEVANVFRETFRESDIIARIGGDEFVVLAIETDSIGPEVLANRLQEKLEAHDARGDRRYKLSLSTGTARYDPERPCSIDEMLARADRAMYEKKQRNHQQ